MRSRRAWAHLALIGVAAGWAWGVQTVRLRIFPYALLEAARSSLAGEGAAARAPLADEEIERLVQHASAIRASTFADPAGLRADLKRRLLLPQDRVSLAREAGSGTEERLSARFYGIRVSGRLAHAEGPGRGCLVVFHQGHGGSPFRFGDHNRLRERILAGGCDFLSMSMLGTGQNAGPASFPSRAGGGPELPIRLSPRRARDHGSYSLFRDPSLPDLDPLALFLSGHYWIIDSLSRSYTSISLVGISGGGWYTTMLAALLPGVGTSVSVAGSMPQFWRTQGHDLGDYEQAFAPLWRDFDYWQLYFLALLDPAGAASRRASLVYGDRDPCCFAEPSASELRSVLEQVGGPQVIVERRDRHGFDVEGVERLLQ